MRREHKIWIKNRLAGRPLYDPRRMHACEQAWAVWARVPGPADPPHLVKERAVLLAATQYGHRRFVETGTRFGDMIRTLPPA